MFLLCGDINPNPGPRTKISCDTYFRTITKSNRFVKCKKCHLPIHIKCKFVTPAVYNLFQTDPSVSYTCQSCISSTLPFTSSEDFNENFNIPDGNKFEIHENLGTNLSDKIYAAVYLNTKKSCHLSKKKQIRKQYGLKTQKSGIDFYLFVIKATF